MQSEEIIRTQVTIHGNQSRGPVPWGSSQSTIPFSPQLQWLHLIQYKWQLWPTSSKLSCCSSSRWWWWLLRHNIRILLEILMGRIPTTTVRVCLFTLPIHILVSFNIFKRTYSDRNVNDEAFFGLGTAKCGVYRCTICCVCAVVKLARVRFFL